MRNHDKALGTYLGAAIGDAMGGPVEGSHARRIQRLVGEIRGLIPYQKPYSLNDPHPGYALRTDAGAITDDTFIRVDFTRFFLATKPPRTPQLLVEWLLANADFSGWWQPIIEALYRVQRGDVKAEEGGLTFFQGGGIGWWTPVGILQAGNPNGAAEEVRNLSRVWKAPLEQDFLAAVQAGVAEGMREGATFDSVVEAILAPCGPLACRFFERAIDIARKAANIADLIDGLYSVALMPELERRHIEEPPRDVDAELPPVITPLVDSDGKYMSSFFAEQAPFALAAFIYAKGDPQIAIPACVMLGRDCDSTATTVGSWVGALHGESGLPRDWVVTVCNVNRPEVDLREMAERLYQLAN